jgi:hypothetical protein
MSIAAAQNPRSSRFDFCGRGIAAGFPLLINMNKFNALKYMYKISVYLADTGALDTDGLPFLTIIRLRIKEDILI